MKRSLQPGAEKGAIERLIRVPGVEPDAYFTAAVVQSPCDELALVRVEVHFRAVGRIARNGRDGSDVDPGMAPVERPRPLGMQHDAWRGHGLFWSTASMYASVRFNSVFSFRALSSERTRSSSSLLLIGLVTKSSAFTSRARSMSLG